MKLMCGGRKPMPAHITTPSPTMRTVSVSRKVANSRAQLSAGRRRGRTSVALFIWSGLWSGHVRMTDIIEPLQDRVQGRLVAGELDHPLEKSLVELLRHQIRGIKSEAVRAR